MRRRIEYLHQIIPEGQAGDAQVIHASRNGRTRTILKVEGEEVMSDSYLEWCSNQEFLEAVRGDVFIAGLGLGYVIFPLRGKREVTSITVLEKSQGVVDLIGPLLRWPHLRVELGDIFGWTPPESALWDTIYFDMLKRPLTPEETAALMRKFSPHLRPGGWIGTWRSFLRT